jgi:two-component system response regulator GlrR
MLGVDRMSSRRRKELPMTSTPSNPHVLVVDDEPTLRVMFTILLEGVGYTVTAAASAESALRRLEQNDFDVVLTDLLMPGVGGVELIAMLARIRAGLPVIAMSAADEDLRLQARAAGACAVLRKPVPVGALLAAIEHALDETSHRSPAAA